MPRSRPTRTRIPTTASRLFEQSGRRVDHDATAVHIDLRNDCPDHRHHSSLHDKHVAGGIVFHALNGSITPAIFAVHGAANEIVVEVFAFA